MTRSTPVSAAEDPALASALDAILRTQGARYLHIATWAIGLWSVTGAETALIWCLVTMAMGTVRGLAERAIERTARRGGDPAKLGQFYPWIASGVGAFWAAAPVLAWHGHHPFGPAMAILMLTAGFMLVLTQFRGSPRTVMIISAPYVAVLAYMAASAVGGPMMWPMLATAPILAGTLGFAVIYGVVAQNRMVRARQSAERESTRLALALEAANATVWEIDVANRTVLADARLWALIGSKMRFRDLIRGPRNLHPDDRARYAEAMERALKGASRHALALRVLHPTHGEVWTHNTFETFAGPGGAVARITIMTMDISEQKRQEAAIAEIATQRDAAEAANVAKSQFLANMSHELRTPLNAIIGYSELLYEDAQSRADQGAQGDLDRVLAAARRLLHLINDVLDLSKIEAGRLDVEISTVDLGKLAREVIETILPAAATSGNTVSLHVDEGLDAVRTDGFKLGQCMLNLASNAAKFTENGRISIRVRREGAMVAVEVTDTGLGMTPEQVGRLFQPFIQADASVTRRFGGTGLGLAITRRIAQALGGDVTVTSTPGVGSTFTLRIVDEAPSLAAANDDTFTHVNGPRVLVIDDDASARDLVRRTLSRAGFSVVGAPDAASGRRAMAQERPSLLVLDIDLPDANGWTMLDALKRDPATAAIPVIVMSIDDDRARSLSLGAVEHFTKPADLDTLAAIALRCVGAQALPQAVGF